MNRQYGEQSNRFNNSLNIESLANQLLEYNQNISSQPGSNFPQFDNQMIQPFSYNDYNYQGPLKPPSEMPGFYMFPPMPQYMPNNYFSNDKEAPHPLGGGYSQPISDGTQQPGENNDIGSHAKAKGNPKQTLLQSLQNLNQEATQNPDEGDPNPENFPDEVTNKHTENQEAILLVQDTPTPEKKYNLIEAGRKLVAENKSK